MKGYPFTRKTEVARIIATSVKCPVLSLDELLELISPNPPSLSNTCTQQPQDLAFNMICQIVESNLLQGFVKDIVIDSSLSSRSHLDQLIKLAKSAEQTQLIIVECKTDKIYKWQTIFEEYHSNQDQNPAKACKKWYKAKNWEDVVKAIRDGYDDEVYYELPKLVVDPLSLYAGSNVPVTESSPLAPFIYVMRYMILDRGGTRGPRVVVYDLWRQGHYHTSGGDESLNDSCKTGAHDITDAEASGLDSLIKCHACESQLAEGKAAYKCKHCSYAFHKECDGLLGITITNGSSGAISSDDLNRLLREGVRDCSKQKDSYDPSTSSKACVLTTLLETHRMPRLIRHECHLHVLAAEMSHQNPYGEYCNCRACGAQLGECIWYTCKLCNISYHYSCLTELPLRPEHEHGAHHHHMLLQYSCEEAEDYLCDVCFERMLREKRDPSCWFYHCEECHYVAHFNCVQDGKTLLS